MEVNSRPSRWRRRVIAGLAALAGAVAVVVAQALPGNSYGIPVVRPGARAALLSGAGVMAGVVIWALAGSTALGRSRRRAESPPERLTAPLARDVVEELPEPQPVQPVQPVQAAPPIGDRQRALAEWKLAQPPAPPPVETPRAVAPPAVLHRLRSQGWYVADSVHLSRIDIDHVAVGPAGVLAVQVMSTYATDPTTLPLTRARVAAEHFQRLLLTKELEIEVVPAMLVWGDRLDPMAGGVLVVDAVAVLSGQQCTEWMAELSGKELLEASKVLAVRDILAEVVMGGMSDVTVAEPAILQPQAAPA